MALGGGGIEEFEVALGCGEAGVVEDGGVIGEPESAGDVGDGGGFVTENPFGGDGGTWRLGKRRRGVDERGEEKQERGNVERAEFEQGQSPVSRGVR